MSLPEIKVTGRVLTLSASTVARNQNLGAGDTAKSKAEQSAPGDPIARPSSRIRQDKKPLLNQLETEWYHVLKRSYPPDVPVFPQAMRFRLANGLWYKVDFVVFGKGQIYGYEVKGQHSFRGGMENLKMAATVYREIKWYLVWKIDGEWQEQHVLA